MISATIRTCLIAAALNAAIPVAALADDRVALMGGMGYPYTETQAGMPTLKARLEKLGFKVILVNWADRQAVYNFMHNCDGLRIYAGDSLGAGSAAQYAGDIKCKVAFVGGFQPSLYDARTRFGYQSVAPNVVRAVAFYNPVWPMTMGLGAAQYAPRPGVTNIPHYGFHPDDWGYTQDYIFNQIKSLKH